jgi:rubredoxin
MAGACLAKSCALKQRPGQGIESMKTYMCVICGYVYDEAKGDPEHGLEPGTRWEDVPLNWQCPECGAGKEDFEMTEI